MDEQVYEIYESKKKLETLIEKEVKYFAYSNGRFTKTTKDLVKKAGYVYALGVTPRPFNFVTKLRVWDLPRYNLTNKTFGSFEVKK
jgi:peptidoglycan/xylan/chitin deacetylase (PgdA/CDA1 family)